MAEEVLFKIDIDNEGAIKATKDLTSAIIDQQDAIKKTKKATKELEKAEGDNTEQIEQNKIKLVEQKDALTKLRAERRQTIKSIDDSSKKTNTLQLAYFNLNKEVVLARTRAKNLGAQYGITSKQFIKAQKEVLRLDKKIKDLDKSVGLNQRNVGNYPKFFGSALSSFKTLLAGFGLFEAVKKVFSFAKESREIAIQAKGIEFAFERLGETGADALERVRAATRGLLSDLEIKKSLVEFDNFNISLAETDTLFEFLSIRAIQTGKSVDKLRDSLVEGLSKESKLRIDNLGISTQELNDELAKTPNFVQAVANIAKREVAEAGNIIDEAGSSQARFNANLQDFQVLTGKGFIARASDSFFDLGSSILRALTPIKSLVPELEKQRFELFILESKIKDVNTTNEERVKLIEDLIELYPPFLKDIDSETISNEELSKAIKLVNDELINKIILQTKDEEIAKATEKAGERRIELFNQEDIVRKKLVEFAQKQNIVIKEGLTLEGQARDVIEQATKARAEQGKTIKGRVIDPLAELSFQLVKLGLIQKSVNQFDEESLELLNERGELLERLGIKTSEQSDIEQKSAAITLKTLKESLEKQKNLLESEEEEQTRIVIRAEIDRLEKQIELFEKGAETIAEAQAKKDKTAQDKKDKEDQKILDSLRSFQDKKTDLENQAELARIENADERAKKALEQDLKNQETALDRLVEDKTLTQAQADEIFILEKKLFDAKIKAIDNKASEVAEETIQKTLEVQKQITRDGQLKALEGTSLFFDKKQQFAQDDFDDTIAALKKQGLTVEEFALKSIEAQKEFNDKTAAIHKERVSETEEIDQNDFAGRRQRANDHFDQALQDLKDALEKEKITKEEFVAAEAERKKERDEELDVIEGDRREQIREVAIQAAQETADATFEILQRDLERKFDIKQKALDKEQKAEQKALKEQRKQGLITEAEFNKKQEELDKKHAIEQHKLDVEKFKADKLLAISKILINTGIGITAALTSFPPNVPLSIAVGIAGAAQLAVAATQQPPPAPSFAEGGTVIKGRSHAQGGENIHIGGRLFGNMQGGEGLFVTKKEATADALSFINQSHGGRSFSGKQHSAFFQEGGQVVAPAEAPGVPIEDLQEALSGMTFQVAVTDIQTAIQGREEALKVTVV